MTLRNYIYALSLYILADSQDYLNEVASSEDHPITEEQLASERADAALLRELIDMIEEGDDFRQFLIDNSGLLYSLFDNSRDGFHESGHAATLMTIDPDISNSYREFAVFAAETLL